MGIGIEVKLPKQYMEKIKNMYKELAEPVMVAVAIEVQNELSSQKPPKPKKGAMQFVSAKQRAFVMASIANGTIQVPYRRGMDVRSDQLNRSFKLQRAPSSVFITSSARYWRYVIGDKQAKIHQGRWKTVNEMTLKVVKSGVIQDVASDILSAKFGDTWTRSAMK
jgi:hypothetical protein